MAVALLTTYPQRGVVSALWAALVSSENGIAATINRWADRTVTVSGTFDTGTCTIQGSNDQVNWFTCTDFLGNPMVFTAAGMMTFGSNPYYTRPSNNAGAGAMNLRVEMSGRMM